MTLPRFRPCEAFAAAAALLEVPHRATDLQHAGLLEAFPAGPVRQVTFLIAAVPNVVAAGWALVFEDRTMLEWLVRRLRDPRGDDDAQKRAFGDVVDYDAIERLVAQWTQLTAAVRTDGRALLDELASVAAADPTDARAEAAIALYAGHAA